MRSDLPSSPHKTSSASDAEDYPVWKRWGDLDEHGKPRPSPNEEPERDAVPAKGASEERNGAELAGNSVDIVQEDPRSWEADFSALDIRDRVVIMLLFKQVVQIEDVEAAWRRFQSTDQGRSREPLWRILARDPAFDRDRILAEAARSAGYEAADVDPMQAAEFIDAHFKTFSETDWERMLRLSVVPIGRDEDPRSGRERFVFIAPDPTRPGVAKLLRDLDVDSFVLRFASEQLIDSLLADLTGRAPAREADVRKRPERSPKPEPPHAAPEPEPHEPPLLHGTPEPTQNGAAAPAPTDLPDERAVQTVATSGEEVEATDDPAPSVPSPAGDAHDLFEECLTESVSLGAKGVHLLPVDEGVRIDMRIGGELKHWRTCPRSMGEQLLAIVKESALNIKPSEIDSVQDGMIRRRVGDATVRFRVSVLPIAGGWSEDRRESVVISILGEGAPATDLAGLGLPDETLNQLRTAIAEPRGMVVLAGPSGSGRAATLNAILHEIVTPKVNVITLEESVNYEAQGVRQVRLSHKVDHEDALEAVRRHDPDVILVGELRTKETAELALKLANAGHLVFSRLPAHDTTGVISRLFRLEVDPFLIAYAINLLVAQRLVRRLCPDCKQPAKHVDGELLRRLGFSRQEIASTKFYDEGTEGECDACGGRRFGGTRIIAEAMPFTHDTRRLIALADRSFDEEDVRAQAVGEGMTTIRASAREVVKRGETSVGELIRATAGEH